MYCNRNIASNRGEKNFEIYYFWLGAVQKSWHGADESRLSGSRYCKQLDASQFAYTHTHGAGKHDMTDCAQANIYMQGASKIKIVEFEFSVQ